MTVLRRDLGATSSYFNRLLSGLGARGSSFTDVDAVDLFVSHDGATSRLLVQEFKAVNEAVSKGQWRTLAWLASRPSITVWCVRRTADEGVVEWMDVAEPSSKCLMDVSEYQGRFARWWMPGTAMTGAELVAIRRSVFREE